ncbi:hypothetical protein DPMN_090505 [Dreissena polymorpha]|uniref:Uncharacterized protein n=1 Tax=Dreissena polymorpha TaxID=45954 RepID=A0A9D4KYC2_DREPO|nr:hypothetical protein DPMN_090505 [Dreissena polymorpha]
MMWSTVKNYCDLMSTSERDVKSVETYYPITVLLDIEVHRMQRMVNILEALERGLAPSEQNSQTTSDNDQTSYLIGNQVM